MVLSYNNLIGIPVFDNKNNKLGIIKDIILDPENGLFLSLVINNKFTLIDEVNEFKEDQIVIKKSPKKINDLPENIRNIIQKNIDIKNNKVYTISGENLGKVSDFEIDLISNKISKIYVSGSNIIKKLIRGELIILKEQIISIEKDKITVEDIVIKSKSLKNKFLSNEEKELAGVSYSIKFE